jgi:hypothetical protein
MSDLFQRGRALGIGKNQVERLLREGATAHLDEDGKLTFVLPDGTTARAHGITSGHTVSVPRLLRGRARSWVEEYNAQLT